MASELAGTKNPAVAAPSNIQNVKWPNHEGYIIVIMILFLLIQ